MIAKKFPIQYKAPLNNVINRELTSYKVLLASIRESVADLLANIDGLYPRPLEIEALWSGIQQNRVPEKWRKVSFQTAYDSLADYIVELGLKLEFWKKVVEADTAELPSFWLPAFFDPKSFLTALIQTRARLEGIPMKDLRNEYEILDIGKNEEPSTDKHVVYIHGLALEGADWDYARKLVVETARTERFVPFPAIAVHTLKLGEATGPAATPMEAYANFGLNNAKKRTKKKKSPEDGAQGQKAATGAEAYNPVERYKCPLFKTTLRLSAGLVATDN